MTEIRAMTAHGRARARSAATGAILALGALLACKKKQADVTPAPVVTESPNAAKGKELRPKVKERLDVIKALGKKVKSEPAVKSDQPFKTKLEESKFLVIGDKWVDDVHHRATADEIELDDNTHVLCSFRLDKAEPDNDDLRYMQECLDWTHVAVLRPKKIEMPKIKLASKSFDPGHVGGDMLLFEIKTGEIKGRYKMAITNSDKLTWVEGKPESEWFDESKRDLAENVIGVAEEQLKGERDKMH